MSSDTSTSARGPVARIGSLVRVRGEWGEEEFTIVAIGEGDSLNGRLSEETPLAGALIGHVAGERLRFRAAGGIMGVTLVAVR